MRCWWIVVGAACGSSQPLDHTSPQPMASGDSSVAAPVVSLSVATPRADLGERAERVERAGYSLVDNRHAAHRRTGDRLILDAGDIGFARYTRAGIAVSQWSIGTTVDGARASIAERIAALDVPLAAAPTQLAARVHGRARQTLTVRFGTRTARAPLATDGWQTIAIAIAPPDGFAPGEHTITLESSGGKLAYQWLAFAAQPITSDDDPRTLASFDSGQRALSLARDSEFEWYATVPATAELVASDVAAGCRVEVVATTSDRPRQVLGSLTETVRRVSLAAIADRAVGLSLVARDCPRARIGNPEIRLAGAAVADPPPVAKPPRYVVLWIMDALRADKLPPFQPGARAHTPTLSELAKTGIVYRQYYVQGNESQVSHSTMWTGVYPAVHNVRIVGKPGGVGGIPKKFAVLAEAVRGAGFRTEAVTANGFINDCCGYARGFDKYRNMMREANVINGLIFGEKIVAPALARLDTNRANPVYLYIGTVDTHGPWVARKPWIDIYSPPPYNGPFVLAGTADGLGIRPDSMGCHIIPKPPDIERMRAIYDSAISYQDQLVGNAIAKLKEWGIWDQTMLIITADHGEEWFEDGRCNHGGSQRDSLVRVPMLVHYPAGLPSGVVVEEGVEAVDLLPTIADVLSITPPAQVQGASMIPLAHGVGRGWPRPSYSSMYELSHAMRIGRWKMRVDHRGAASLYDMVGSPDELTDLAASHAVERRMLADSLNLFLALRWQWKKTTWGVASNLTATGADELDRATSGATASR